MTKRADNADKDWFARVTVTAAQALDMQGYVHWDAGLFLDNAATARTVDYLQQSNGSLVGCAFMFGSDPFNDKWQVARTRSIR